MPNYSHFITYGITALIILIIISLVIGRYKNSYGRKEKELQGQIKSLFRPHEELTVIILSERLIRVTAGRRNLSDVRLYRILDLLVAKGDLKKRIMPFKKGNFETQKITYRLP